MLHFASMKPDVQKYIPDQWNHTDKEWLQNVLFSVATEEFDELIEKVCDTVRAKREEVKVQTALIRPEFAIALKEAKDFSSKLYSNLNLNSFREERPSCKHGCRSSREQAT
jgi:predicted RNA-binding protein with PIN domain